eukprot:5348278-Prymnesium_polylepis.2
MSSNAAWHSSMLNGCHSSPSISERPELAVSKQTIESTTAASSARCTSDMSAAVSTPVPSATSRATTLGSRGVDGLNQI